MSNAGKKTTVKDEFVAPQIKLEEEQKGAAVSVKQQIEAYLQRKAEVTQSDDQAFQDYLNQKAQAPCAARCPGARAAIEVQSP